VIRRHDDGQRERHDASDEQGRDQPAKSATLEPHRDTAEKADDRQWRLQSRSALVAGSPLLSRRARLEAHTCGMFRNVDVQSRPGEQRSRKHGEKLESYKHRTASTTQLNQIREILRRTPVRSGRFVHDLRTIDAAA
jgi:hypothetical protein